MTSPKVSELVKTGAKAPHFDLESYKDGVKGKVSLSDFAGKKNVILAFYPKDDTPGCTKEMCSFTEDSKLFEAAHTELLGISCDTNESHEKFAQKHSLKHTLLADKGGNVGQAYGTVVEGKATANRVAFVIDKAGIVRHVIEGMPKNSELLELVKTL